MGLGKQLREHDLNRYMIYRLKLIELIHFYLLHDALRNGQFVPENVLGHDGEMFAGSLRTPAMAWAWVLVDDTEGALNMFELWPRLFPKERNRIAEVEARVKASLNVIKEFRNKVAFHADTPLAYFRAKQAIVKRKELAADMQAFMELAKYLIEKESETLPELNDQVETCILDLELQLDVNINREWFKKALILRRDPIFRKTF